MGESRGLGKDSSGQRFTSVSTWRVLSVFDDLGSDVMGLEQEGVASDGEVRSCEPPGGTGVVGDVVHLRREGDAGRARVRRGATGVSGPFERTEGRWASEIRSRRVRRARGWRGGAPGRESACTDGRGSGPWACPWAPPPMRCLLYPSRIVARARANAAAGYTCRRLPASEIATSKIFLPVVSGFANPTSSMKIPARPGVSFETTPSPAAR